MPPFRKCTEMEPHSHLNRNRAVLHILKQAKMRLFSLCCKMCRTSQTLHLTTTQSLRNNFTCTAFPNTHTHTLSSSPHIRPHTPLTRSLTSFHRARLVSSAQQRPLLPEYPKPRRQIAQKGDSGKSRQSVHARHQSDDEAFPNLETVTVTPDHGTFQGVLAAACSVELDHGVLAAGHGSWCLPQLPGSYFGALYTGTGPRSICAATWLPQLGAFVQRTRQTPV